MKRSVRDWKVTVMGWGRCGRAILDRLLREGRPESAIFNEFSKKSGRATPRSMEATQAEGAANCRSSNVPWQKLSEPGEE